jgi:radical SAM protein with 4Fe4S-binding SPASM domain
METATFKSTVNQAVDMGVELVLPFIDGEPLADPRMLDLVEWMAATHPSLECGWYTNAGLLTEERARRLLGAGNIRHFNISMQGGDKATYERNMGISWDTTIENVERFIHLNREMGKPVNIRAHMCIGGPSIASIPAFKERWEKFPEVLICLGAFSNFGGLVGDEVGDAPWRNKPRMVCDRGTRHLYVAWNGDVIQCCFDLVASIVYGNVQEQPLAAIWNSDAAVASRAAHWELRVAAMPPICRNCSAAKFHG